jgi:bifunctional non-homologous end joining protein LigD
LRLPSRFVRPCLPVFRDTIPVGEAWLHEPMIEGYRFQAAKYADTVELRSRCGREWGLHFSRLARALGKLLTASALLDGLIVPADRPGAPKPRSLPEPAAIADSELIFFAFDLLSLDGRDMRPMPLFMRKRKLTRLITQSQLRCLHSVHTTGDGAELLSQVRASGLRGIVSKRRRAPYRSGRCADWVAICDTPAPESDWCVIPTLSRPQVRIRLVS